MLIAGVGTDFRLEYGEENGYESALVLMVSIVVKAVSGGCSLCHFIVIVVPDCVLIAISSVLSPFLSPFHAPLQEDKSTKMHFW